MHGVWDSEAGTARANVSSLLTAPHA